MRFNIRSVLAVIILLGSFSILGVLLFKPIPVNNKDVVNTAIGMILGASVTGVMGYYYNDSKKKENNDKV